MSEHAVPGSVPSRIPSRWEAGPVQLLRWDRARAWGTVLVTSQVTLFGFFPLCPSGLSKVTLVSYPGKKRELLRVPLPPVTSPKGVESHGVTMQ